SWTNWNITEIDREFFEFVGRLARVRHSHPILQRRTFFKGKLSGEDPTNVDVIWLNEDGTEMTSKDWTRQNRRHFGVIFNGNEIDEIDDEGNFVTGSNLLIICNSHWDEIEFVLPPNPSESYARIIEPSKCWKLVLETTGLFSPSCWELKTKFLVSPRSLTLFELADKDENLPYLTV
ncbi:MAG: hypothetical protein K8F91_08930, partial [Candidatus Obscuribacterales bacterium]|nr:hypothetical protein [Candidatus Obscuribacterales bacterium]